MKKIFSGLAVLLVVMLLFGTFSDLNIAKTVFVEGNGFSEFFYRFAPVVFGTIILLSAALIFVPTLKMKNVKLMTKIGSGLVAAFLKFFGIFMCFEYMKIFGLIYAVLVLACLIFAMTKISPELLKNYWLVGWAIFLTALCSMIFVEGLKPIVGRVRFRSMQEDFSLFTNWYQINGDKYLSSVPLKEEIKSFPSGHSQWAGTTLTLSMLTFTNPKLKSKEKLVFFGTLVYACIVMFSRMAQGAHFLSDVTVGFSTAFVFFLIFRYFIVEKNMEKEL